MSTPKGIAFGVGLCFVVAATIFVLSLVRPASHGVKLPDGSTLAFKTVTYGTNHYFQTGGSWHKAMALLSRNNVTSNFLYRCGVRLPPRLFFRSVREIMTTWFVWRPGASNRGIKNTVSYVILDEVGWASEVRQFNRQWFDVPGRGGVLFCDSSSFPRRHPFFRLRIVDRQDGRELVLAELRIPNPVFRRSPNLKEWKLERLPITKSSGDAAFTLEECSVMHGGPSGRSYTATPITWFVAPQFPRGALSGFRYQQFVTNSSFAEARVDVRQNGRASEDWVPVEYELTDATGNRIQYPLYPNLAPDQKNGIALQPCLWPTEPAWKLRLEFARKPSASFGPEELVTFEHLPVPAAGAFLDVGVLTNVLGMNLVLSRIQRGSRRYPPMSARASGWSVPVSGTSAGERPLRFEPRTGPLQPFEQNEPSVSLELEFQAAPTSPNVRLIILEAPDDQGQSVAKPAFVQGRFGMLYNGQVDVSSEARTFDLHLAVQHSRVVEYVVKPEVR